MSPSEYEELVDFLTGKFAQIDGTLTRIDGQFTRIDHRFDDLTLQIERRFVGLEGRLDAFQAEVEERFRKISGHFDEVYRRLERLEQESDRGGADRRGQTAGDSRARSGRAEGACRADPGAHRGDRAALGGLGLLTLALSPEGRGKG